MSYAHLRVVAMKFVRRLACKFRRLKKARITFCHRCSQRGVDMGGGRPLTLGEGLQGNFKNFNSIWCPLVQSGGLFYAKRNNHYRGKIIYTCVSILLFTIHWCWNYLSDHFIFHMNANKNTFKTECWMWEYKFNVLCRWFYRSSSEKKSLS